MKVDVRTQPDPYTVHIERGILRRAGEILPLNRRVLVVTDSGVPKEYAETVCAQCAAPTAVTLPSGEETKSFSSLQTLCRVMLEKGFTRTDAVVAVGGGVIGDLAGFAASVYMRGIDFFNFPTTLLSQVDSSIGGKTAVNFEGVKNVIGTFYQPFAVLIDPLTLDTLPKRQIASGMAEVIKMAATFDADLFEALENGNLSIEEIIARALQIKARVVEADTREAGLRRVLNFGHTVGHGIESAEGLGGLTHGECVALGMLVMSGGEMHEQIRRVLKKWGLPTEIHADISKVLEALSHDKKASGDRISVITCDAPGSYSIETLPMETFKARVTAVLKGDAK